VASFLTNLKRMSVRRSAASTHGRPGEPSEGTHFHIECEGNELVSDFVLGSEDFEVDIFGSVGLSAELDASELDAGRENDAGGFFRFDAQPAVRLDEPHPAPVDRAFRSLPRTCWPGRVATREGEDG
jgi:hypothetical protein